MIIATDVLAGLDDVAWGNLHHAYGTAADVPDHLRTICGGDDEARREAFSELSNNICHQGSRYAASPFAVPFLARIAVAGPGAARVDALGLLKMLAVDWYDEYELPLGINTVAWRAAVIPLEETLRELDEEIAAETRESKRQWLQDVRSFALAGNPIDGREGALRSYDAVRRELPLLLPLLGDLDLGVRRETAYLVSWFPEDSAGIVPALAARAGSETDPRVLATVIVAIGLLGTLEQIGLLEGQLDAAEPLVRWAGATGLARFHAVHGGLDSELLARAFAELVAVAVGPRVEAGTDHNDGSLHAYTGRSLLLFLDRLPVDEVLEGVAACLRHITIRQCDDLASKTLTRTFDVQGVGPTPALAELSPGQRSFVRALADHPGAFSHHRLAGLPLADVLRVAGLPCMGRELRDYTDLPPIITVEQDPWMW